MAELKGYTGPSKCDKNCQVVLVTGYRGNHLKRTVEDKAKSAAWELYASLFDLRPSQRAYAPISVIINDCSPFERGWSQENLQMIRKRVLKMRLCGGITLIFFAHSYGANVLYQALKTDEFKIFLKRQGFCESRREQKIREIRNHMAVITLGGTQDIPQDFAKISQNICLDEDGKAQFFKGILEDTHGKRVIRMKIAKEKATPAKQKKAKSSRLGGLFASASASSSTRGSHYLSDYVENESVCREIYNVLDGK